MNPGYLSLVLLVVSLILFVSGWTDFFMRGITSKVILLFFISWLVAMGVVIPLPHARIGLWTVVLLVITIAVLKRVHGLLYKLHIISVGVLLGSVSFFMQETVHLVPTVMFGSVGLSMALMIGMLVSALIKLPAVQVAVISIGLLLGEAYFRYIHKDHIGFYIGSAALQDRWWLTVYMTRMVSLLLAGLTVTGKKSLLRLASAIRKKVRYRYRGD